MNINSGMGLGNIGNTSTVPKKQQNKVASFQATPIQFGNGEQKKPNWLVAIGGTLAMIAVGLFATSGSDKPEAPQLSAQQIQQNAIGQEGFPVYDTNQIPSNSKK